MSFGLRMNCSLKSRTRTCESEALPRAGSSAGARKRGGRGAHRWRRGVVIRAPAWRVRRRRACREQAGRADLSMPNPRRDCPTDCIEAKPNGSGGCRIQENAGVPLRAAHGVRPASASSASAASATSRASAGAADRHAADLEQQRRGQRRDVRRADHVDAAGDCGRASPRCGRSRRDRGRPRSRVTRSSRWSGSCLRSVS